MGLVKKEKGCTGGRDTDVHSTLEEKPRAGGGMQDSLEDSYLHPNAENWQENRDKRKIRIEGFTPPWFVYFFCQLTQIADM